MLPSLCRLVELKARKKTKLFMIMLHRQGSGGKRRCWKMRLWIKRMQISKAQYIKEDMSGVYYEQHATKFKAIKAKFDRDNILKSFE